MDLCGGGGEVETVIVRCLETAKSGRERKCRERERDCGGNDETHFQEASHRGQSRP